MKHSILLLISLALMACQSDKKSSAPKSNDLSEITKSGSLSLNITPNALLRQTLPDSQNQRAVAFDSTDIFVGNLKATNTGTGAFEDFAWSIFIDDTDFTTESNKTIVLAPGTYDFELTVSRGDQSYMGEALGQIITDGENTIALTIQPIIGDSTVDVNLDASLSEFRFQYDSNELSVLSLTNPQIGITVGTNSEQIFALNLDGSSDVLVDSVTMFNLLPEGPHHVELRLLDGNLQIGKSIDAQEDIEVIIGQNINMDLIPLHGETVFNLTEAGGDASFTFNIPADVITEAGGLANLQTTFKMAASPNNAAQQRVLTLTPNGADFQATEVITGFQLDTVDLSLEFEDISKTPAELIGTCLLPAVLFDTLERTLTCNLTLIRRAVLGGHFKAVLGVNVFDMDQVPVAGASVSSSDGSFLGITGSGTFGTAGYVRGFLEAGSHLIRAEAGSFFGESNISLQPFEIRNIDITLNQLLSNWPGVLQIGSTDLDDALEIAADSQGNVYITGKTSGNFNGETNLGANDAFLAKYNPDGLLQWTELIGTPGQESGLGVAVDPDDFIYVSGLTGGNLHGNINAGTGNDIFLAKYDTTGARIWTQQIGSNRSDEGAAVATSSLGHVYVVGRVENDLEGQPYNGGNLDAFITQFDSDGNPQWTRLAGTTQREQAFAVTTDSAGNAYVAGETNGLLDGQPNQGTIDMFLIKYDVNGTREWTRTLGSTENDGATGVVVGQDDHVYVSGTVALGGNFDGHSSSGNNDIFIAKYDLSGNKIWSLQDGESSFDDAVDLTIDINNNLYVTGFTTGGLGGIINAGDGSCVGQSECSDMALLKYNSDGVRQWVQQLGSPVKDEGHGVTVDSFGGVYVAGTTIGDLDGNPNAGNSDAFIVKYDADGNQL